MSPTTKNELFLVRNPKNKNGKKVKIIKIIIQIFDDTGGIFSKFKIKN